MKDISTDIQKHKIYVVGGIYRQIALCGISIEMLFVHVSFTEETGIP